MKVLITGANGFVGKNLKSNLSLNSEINIYEYTRNSTDEDLKHYTKDCDFVFHLAGVNRTNDLSEYMKGNYDLTKKIIDLLKENNNCCPIMVSSSIQAELDNEYGISKRKSEEILRNYGRENNVEIYIYRFPNLFGKWCKPNYNSVIATWCYNISHNLDITVNDFNKELNLVYIDDVCNELINCLNGKANKEGEYCVVKNVYRKTLGEISNLIKSFKDSSRGIFVPKTGDTFIKKLYATYISYVPLEEMIVDLEEHRDDRGIFCELIKTEESGQISVSTTKPYIVRGGHYHNTKMERFIVVKGKAKIEFEHVIDHTKIEFEVSDDKLQYVTIPVGYQHRINNIGDNELVLILWANEIFDKNVSDTYVMEE